MPRDPVKLKAWRDKERVRNKERYHSDPEYRTRILSNTRKWQKKNPKAANAICYRLREKRRLLIDKIKSESACKICGESDPRCLDFHHRDPSQKEHVPALMAPRGLKIETILAEIAKCDVLCSNCHRKHHADERARKRHAY